MMITKLRKYIPSKNAAIWLAIWAYLITPTKNDSINLQKTLTFISTHKKLTSLHTSFKRYYTLGNPVIWLAENIGLKAPM